MGAPLTFSWDGEAFRPATPRQAAIARERWQQGDRVQLEELFERSQASHNQYFASLADAWANLPEKYALEYPTSEHLRKRALCLTGWHTRQDFVCGSKAEATRTAAIVRSVDEYALVVIDGNIVSRLTAKSQRQNRMKKAEFEKSKRDVLAYAWGLSGIDAETGELHGGRAA